MKTEGTRDVKAVPTKVETADKSGGSKHGLVIGIEKYKDHEIEDLRYTVMDARKIYEMMIDPHCGAFPENNVILLYDDKATFQGIRSAFSQLVKKVLPGDTVWVYFAGHGAVQDNYSYWLPQDAKRDEYYSWFRNTEITQFLEDLKASKKIMFLDCCYANGIVSTKNGMKDILSKYTPQGTITIASSDQKEKSLELERLRQGAFSYYLQKGLEGEAAKDKGRITVEDIWNYLNEKLAKETEKRQNPVMVGEIIHGFPLTYNKNLYGRGARVLEYVEDKVGSKDDDLASEDGKFIRELFERRPQSQEEKNLMDILTEQATNDTWRIEVVRDYVKKAKTLKPTPLSEKEYSSTIEAGSYTLSGFVKTEKGYGISGVKISFGPQEVPVYTSDDGRWHRSGLKGKTIVRPEKIGYSFEPPRLETTKGNTNLEFTAVSEQRKYSIGLRIGHTAEDVIFHMRLAPDATFTVGEDNDKTGIVERPFWIAETPVTYELWYKIRLWAEDEKRGYKFILKGKEGSRGKEGRVPSGRKLEPVTNISWYDAVIWCNALSENLGFRPVYMYKDDYFRDATDVSQRNNISVRDIYGFRLPLGAEWELAARYKDGKEWTEGIYASGADGKYTDRKATTAAGWYKKNSRRGTREVGLKPEKGNGLRLYDMSGNVNEWCFDRELEYSGRRRMHRGGSWCDTEELMRVGTFKVEKPIFENKKEDTSKKKKGKGKGKGKGEVDEKDIFKTIGFRIIRTE